jgi:hypothetical protein
MQASIALFQESATWERDRQNAIAPLGCVRAVPTRSKARRVHFSVSEGTLGKMKAKSSLIPAA